MLAAVFTVLFLMERMSFGTFGSLSLILYPPVVVAADAAETSGDLDRGSPPDGIFNFSFTRLVSSSWEPHLLLDEAGAAADPDES